MQCPGSGGLWPHEQPSHVPPLCCSSLEVTTCAAGPTEPMPDHVIRTATAADQHNIIALLQQANLPVGDLAGQTWQHFLVAEWEGAVVGVVGVEPLAGLAQLRSLAVAPEHRRSGLGARLVDAIEWQAMSLEVTQVGLITNTAEAFFRRLEYVSVDRDKAPECLRATAQFQGLCPASSVVMIKDIMASDL